ncbi:hypothetical protein GMORB2_2977 [Geosmithia morbida]|uniref:High-temperature-induced dauer-formation protein n=1 Tax=Geosmithia morbida TaxID=1094350 RepID=A0A9P4YT56_9HYPO|nr:uncharacterized protein GMORB2_2977 [Geosmithia morbida]KAF4120539.1 hypothetical protein GMORB2_2977 [Geosmithia morbida]
MGASDSKLVFKQGIFKLSEERSIPADDSYWTSFWELPESAEDIFSLFSPADVRRTRDKALENLETLILATTSRLFILRHHPSFPDPDLAPERDALNCIRILTRILPFLYEKDTLGSWEERFFWAGRRKRTRKATISNEVLFDESKPQPRESGTEYEYAKPLAEELIDTLVDLLFHSELTLPPQQRGRPKVNYAIWQSGVGCNTTVATTKEYERNRSEIMRLLLTLAGQSMYMTQGVLPSRGVRSLTYLCTCQDKQVVLSVLCSLLNTALKYNPATWRVPYNSLVSKDAKHILVTYSLQLLLTLVLYPIPETQGGATPKNVYRHFLGRVHRPQDFQFIVDGMTRILNQPLQEKASYLPGTQSSGSFTPETMMLFWEITQCNKRFRAYIIDTGCVHDFVVLALFYALEYKNDLAKQGIVRMCAFVLQTLSVEPTFGTSLNKSFEGQQSLPPSIRINTFYGTYADFLIQSIYTLITTSQGKLSAIYPALLAVINNTAPYLEGLSAASSARLLQLFSSMSSPSFLLANETNHTLLHSLLESINAVIEHKYRKNPELVIALVRHKKRIEALRSFTLESGQEEMERRQRMRKDSGASFDPLDPGSLRSSAESTRSPSSAPAHAQTLEEVPEDGAFSIGEDEDDSDDDGDSRPTPAQSTMSDRQSQDSTVQAADDGVPVQLRGMSEKARGKMPANARSFSRQNSTTSLSTYSVSGQAPGGGAFEPTTQWIDSWLPELPLHAALVVIQQVSPVIPRHALARSQDPASPETLRRIRQTELHGVEPSAVRVHSFEWSPLALGWYESLLWGIVFTSEMQVAKGNMGVWNGTAIKLFRVQETSPAGPTLSSPRGAVDAVGNNIVSRIGQINLRGQTSPSQQPSSPAP